MKIIEAMKQIKDLTRKADDLRARIGKHSADLDIEQPTYPDQYEKVQGWLQAHSDILKEILRLRFAIQKTNISTPVTVDLGGVQVTKTVTEWIHRRRDLALLEGQSWNLLTDRNLKDGQMKQSDGALRDVRVRRYYNPEERDTKVSNFKSEPLMIDAKLEVVNATTDLIE